MVTQDPICLIDWLIDWLLEKMSIHENYFYFGSIFFCPGSARAIWDDNILRFFCGFVVDVANGVM